MTMDPSGTVTFLSLNSGQAVSPFLASRMVSSPTMVSASKRWVGCPEFEIGEIGGVDGRVYGLEARFDEWVQYFFW